MGIAFTMSARLQKTVALSSGEAELNAQVVGMSEGLGVSAYVKSGALALNLHAFATAARLVELQVVRESAE